MGDKIYVTNQHTHQLLTLAIDGTVISTFTDIDLKGPRGVHVTPRGQVLVCGDKSNALIQVDNEGKKKLATLATKKDGVNDPRSVLYSSSTDTVIMGFSTNDSIMVFKVTYSAEK
ncbi:hypothetical protein DPMN_184438 [Dreissena polymorpha]|uniref:Uncharacterized protein n=2 Tax=Dreissena polymorpha TaxID=45954 RepID=A0A9D4DJ56_DREPO|nr:hypothetical protein DPMN_184438 [Dreissena polymorpha]